MSICWIWVNGHETSTHLHTFQRLLYPKCHTVSYFNSVIQSIKVNSLLTFLKSDHRLGVIRETVFIQVHFLNVPINLIERNEIVNIYSLKPQEKHIIPEYVIERTNSSKKQREIIHSTLYLSRHSCLHHVTFLPLWPEVFWQKSIWKSTSAKWACGCAALHRARATVQAVFLLIPVCCIVYENNLRWLVLQNDFYLAFSDRKAC